MSSLDLFGRRGLRKGNRWSEFRFTCQVARLLERHCNPAWRATHLPFGELRTKATARRLKAMGVTKGWPDFMFVGPRRICFLELKSFGGRPTKEQSAIAEHISACGFGYAITSDLEDAVSIMQAWGILPNTIHVQ